ncbi:MAG: hypothetical protein WCA85_15210 [Paraburkholderia sp.]|uniref:hypothetical protein n=1 Tax=Paraburkholderia sp. TaxID=1926495 RepID=UPI003C3D0787
MPSRQNEGNLCDPTGHRTRSVPAIAALGLCLQGCALQGAPSYEIFGAYFPLWLLSAILGVVGALIAHRIFVSTGWVQIVPFQLSVCLAIGLTVAVLCWLSGTGQLL